MDTSLSKSTGTSIGVLFSQVGFAGSVLMLLHQTKKCRLFIDLNMIAGLDNQLHHMNSLMISTLAHAFTSGICWWCQRLRE